MRVTHTRADGSVELNYCYKQEISFHGDKFATAKGGDGGEGS